MAKHLRCYHPEIGESLIPPFVAFGVANAEVGTLYCGLFRGDEWVPGTPLHPTSDQSRWVFEFLSVPSGAGWSLWIGELSDTLPMLELYPLSIAVPFVAAQLTVKYPPQNRILPVDNIVAYGTSSTVLNQHTLTLGGMPIPGNALKNEAGRWVVQFTATVMGIANGTMTFRNTDAPMPSTVNRPVRISEVNPI